MLTLLVGFLMMLGRTLIAGQITDDMPVTPDVQSDALPDIPEFQTAGVRHRVLNYLHQIGAVIHVHGTIGQ
jgi:hypothetical protein